MKKRLIITLTLIGIFYLGYIFSNYAKTDTSKNTSLQHELLITSGLNKKEDRRYDIYNRLFDRVEVLCENDKKTKLVFLVFGQSNAANSGAVAGIYESKGNVYNIFNKKCYKAKDPMLQSSGSSASIWPRLGDAIIEKKLAETVLFKTIAIGGRTVKHWGSGYLKEKLVDSINELKDMNIEIDYILFMQGESDNFQKTKKDEYIKEFINIINTFKENNVNAPIILSITSISKGLASSEVRNAQITIINENENILEGPDTDLLNEKGIRKKDRTHFTKEGLIKLKDVWLESIVKKSEVYSK